jgi:heme oxygenase (biliverdin-producing, ferredoxin)
LNTGLPERLKRETRDLHAEAERSGVMGDLLRGRIGARTYFALLRNLFAIYSSLEPALDRACAEPGLAWLRAPALRRAGSLKLDLDHLHSGRWQDDLVTEAATGTYTERVEALAAAAPRRLAAHAYVRYLGDLYGGQALRKVVQKRFGLDGIEGTRFYDFGPPVEVERLRRDFRAGLSNLPVTTAEQDAIVAEARWAFGMHRALFVELQSRYGAAARE